MKVTIDTTKKNIQIVDATSFEIENELPCMVEDISEYKIIHKKPRKPRTPKSEILHNSAADSSDIKVSAVYSGF